MLIRLSKKLLSLLLSFLLIFFQGLVYPSLSIFKVTPVLAVAPVITITSPTNNQYFNNATTVVVINPDQALLAGTGIITITRTGGTADPGSPWTCTLVGTALNSGSHTVDLTDNTNTNHCSSAITLVNGTTYDFAFNGSNAGSEAASAVNVTSVTYDTSAPTLSTSKVTGANAFTVTFNESVNAVAGNFTNLTVGGMGRSVTGVSGSGSGTVVVSFDGAATATSDTGTVDISNGVTDLASNAYAGSANQALSDGQGPTVTTVSSAHVPNNPNDTGSFKAGEFFEVEVTYTENITVNTGGGFPTLALNSGGTATWDHGSASTTQVFNYTVGGGQNSSDLDYSATNSLALNGGTMQDAAGNNTNNILPTPGAANSLGANRNYVIDTTAPVFSSVSPSASSSINNVTSASDISYTLSENVASGTVVVTRTGGSADGNSPHSCTLAGTALNTGAHTLNLSDTTNGCTMNVSNLVDGAIYTFTFDGTDAAGNAAVQVSRASVTFDTTAPSAPSVTLTDPINNGNKTNVSITGTGEASATINYTIADGDGGTSDVTGSSSVSGGGSINITGVNVSSLTDGTLTAAVTLTDAAGNTGSAGTDTATKDVVAPVITVSTPTGSSSINSVTTSSDITYSLDGNVASGTITITRTGGTADGSSPYTCNLVGTGLQTGGSRTINVTDTTNGCNPALTSLVDGAVYTFDFNATDAAGNPATTVSRTSVTFDNSAPGTPVISSVATDGKINNSEKAAIVVAGTAEANSSVLVTLTDSAATTKTGSGTASGGNYSITIDGTTVTALVDGNINVSVTATDAAGNVSSAATTTATQDTVIPVFSSVAPASSSSINNVTTTSDISYSLSETVASATITITRTGGTTDGSSPHTCTLVGTALNSGAHVINLSDTTNGCSSAVTLVDGAVYTMAFNGTDAAGNAASTVTKTSVTFDTTNPGITLTTPTSSSAINNTTTTSDIVYSLDENLAVGSQLIFSRTSGSGSNSYTCTLVGTALNSGTNKTLDTSDTTNGCTSSISLDNGTTYDVIFSGTDAAGNSTTVTRTNIVYDTVAPNSATLSINSGAAYTNTISVTLTISASDAESSVVQMNVYNGSAFSSNNWESYATSKSWTLPSTEGTKTVNIRFRDAAGNENGTLLAQDNIILDTTNPTVSQVLLTNSTSSQTTYVKNGDLVVLTATITDTNQAGMSASNFSADLSGLGVGATASAASFNSGTGIATWSTITVSGTAEANVSATVYVTDPAGNTNTGSDSIDANNSTPVTTTDSLTATKNTALSFTTTTLLSNDTDAGSDSLTFVGVGTTASHGQVTISGLSGTYTPTTGYVGSDSFTYTVSDGFLTSSAGTVNIIVDPPVSSGQAVLSSTNTLSTSAPQLVVGGTTTPATVTIPSSVTNASLDVTNVTTTSGSNEIATVASDVTVNASTPLGTVTMQLPAGIQITGNAAAWNGVVNIPQVQSNSTVVLGASVDTTTTAVIEVGFGDVPLTLSKAVRLAIPGQGGKRAGYQRSGVFSEITTECSADTQAVGDALPAGGDCKFSGGGDMVIWTKHFTKFVAYTYAPLTSPGSSEHCTAAKPQSIPTLLSAVAGGNSVTLTWTDNSADVSYYVITYGLSPGQQQYGNANIGGRGTTSYTVSGLSGGVTYYFRVRNGNGCTTGEYSGELSATPGGGSVAGPAAGFAPGVLGARTQIGIRGEVKGETDQAEEPEIEAPRESVFDIIPTPQAGGGLFGAIGNFFRGIFSFFGSLFGR